MKRANEELDLSLRNAGFKSSVISLQHLSDLKNDFKLLREQETFDTDFFNERLAHFMFEPPDDFPDAQSIIITAAQQPKVKVVFEISGHTIPVIIPPTYSYDTDREALKIILRILQNYNFRACDATLPVKSLAVHSGLAIYGRNNIAYIDEWGSYFRLKAFYSDMPHSEDCWQDYKIMDLCDNCVACLKKCPSGAIRSDRFVFQGERCITFLNERSNLFPDWVDPSWHNCLIGCMICQDVCPMNKHVVNWTVEDGEFSEEETSMILKGVPQNELPENMRERLDRLDLLEEYESLGRNLSVLIHGARESE